METLEAKILFKNLLKRIRKVDDDAYELSGALTDDEVTALRMALESLDGSSSNASVTANLSFVPPMETSHSTAPVTLKPLPEYTQQEPDVATENDHALTDQLVEEPEATRRIELDTSALDLPEAPSDHRLCFDFGTAMSKVTMVRDPIEGRDYEDIDVLKLGVPGDQEEVSEMMLVSSVYIDNDSKLWFGHIS